MANHVFSHVDGHSSFLSTLANYLQCGHLFLQPSDLSSLSAGRSTAGPIRMSLNIFLICNIYLLSVCLLIFITSPLGVAVGLLSI